MKKNLLTLGLLLSCFSPFLAAKNNPNIASSKTFRFKRNYLADLRTVISNNNLTKTEFENIIATEGNVILKFYATWCNPCKTITTSINKLVDSKEFEHVTWVEADIEYYGRMGTDFGVRSVPTLIFYKDGKEVRREKGSKTAADLKKIINEVYS